MKIISENNQDAAVIAAEFLRDGKIIAFATDTIYGIAVDASSHVAVERLYNAKKRDKAKPIAIFLPNLQKAQEIFFFDDVAKKIAQKFLPGPLTLILKVKNHFNLAKNLNCNDEFLGFRIIEKKFLTDLFAVFSSPLAVTSVNISGSEPLILPDEIKNNGSFLNIDLLIDGGICKNKIPSTVVKISQEKIEILRKGALDSDLINYLQSE